MVLKCSLSKVQSEIYRSFCASVAMKKSIQALERAAEHQSVEGSKTSLGSEVLRSLFFLRLLCTHPSLVATKENAAINRPLLCDSGKLLVLADLLRQIGIKDDVVSCAADNDTSLLYCEEEHDENESDLDESAPAPGITPLISARWKEKTSDKGSKCLIFAQFSQSLDVVEESLLKTIMPSVSYVRLDGNVPPSQRVLIAENFNTDPDIKIFLLTTRVGSLGLNLTGADTVIFLEHDWNPFQDLQAMDRAHRIGQTKTVNVYRLVMQETVEERIMDLQRKKKAMNDAVVNAENSSLYSLGTDRLLDIFKVDNQTDTKSHEFDLESLLEQYGVDYTSSLSVSGFLRKSDPQG